MSDNLARPRGLGGESAKARAMDEKADKRLTKWRGWITESFDGPIGVVLSAHLYIPGQPEAMDFTFPIEVVDDDEKARAQIGAALLVEYFESNVDSSTITILEDEPLSPSELELAIKESDTYREGFA